jgi:hypothetical protein
VAEKQITLRVRPDGTIEAETAGMEGSECLQYGPQLERLTDSTLVDSEFTGEYFSGPNEARIATEGPIDQQLAGQDD